MSTTSSQKPESRSPGSSSSSSDSAGLESRLNTPRDRFLAAVVDNALSVGRRTAKDFLQHFPPRAIMNALADQPRLRAKLLVNTTGVNEKVALRKPASSAGEDLEIALAERVTDESDVVGLLDPDDRVRYLEHAKLWDFVIEGEFWRPNEATTVFIPREHIAFILSRARAERLITDGEIVDGIGLDVLVGSLPKEHIVRVLEKAIGEGRAGRVFKDERVLDVLSPQLLVEHVPLAHLWERLIGEKLAFVSPAPTLAVVATPPEESSQAHASPPSDTTQAGSPNEPTQAPTTPPPPRNAPSATALSMTSETPVAVADSSAGAPSSPPRERPYVGRSLPTEPQYRGGRADHHRRGSRRRSRDRGRRDALEDQRSHIRTERDRGPPLRPDLGSAASVAARIARARVTRGGDDSRPTAADASAPEELFKASPSASTQPPSG